MKAHFYKLITPLGVHVHVEVGSLHEIISLIRELAPGASWEVHEVQEVNITEKVAKLMKGGIA